MNDLKNDLLIDTIPYNMELKTYVGCFIVKF